jgi:hypothetical protein
MFTALLKPILQDIYPCTVEEVKHSKQKELRIIDTLEPVMNQHRLCVSADVIQKDFDSTQDLPMEDALRYQLMYQLTRITKDRGALVRDDRLDALAMAVSYWVEQMASHTESAVKDHRQKLLDIELEKFMEHATGRKPQLSGWLNQHSTRPEQWGKGRSRGRA